MVESSPRRELRPEPARLPYPRLGAAQPLVAFRPQRDLGWSSVVRNYWSGRLIRQFSDICKFFCAALVNNLTARVKSLGGNQLADSFATVVIQRFLWSESPTVAHSPASSYPACGRIVLAFLPEALHARSCALSHDPSADRLVAPFSLCRTANRFLRSPRCATTIEREMYFWPHISPDRPIGSGRVVSTLGLFIAD